MSASLQLYFILEMQQHNSGFPVQVLSVESEPTVCYKLGIVTGVFQNERFTPVFVTEIYVF